MSSTIFSFSKRERPKTSLTNCWNRSTIAKSVARVARGAATDGRVIDHSTFGVGRASTSAGIDTFLIDASAIRLTIRAEEALGPAIGHGTDHVGQTAALRLSGDDLTLRTRSARCRRARIRWNGPQSPFFNCRTGYRRYGC